MPNRLLCELSHPFGCPLEAFPIPVTENMVPANLPLRVWCVVMCRGTLTVIDLPMIQPFCECRVEGVNERVFGVGFDHHLSNF